MIKKALSWITLWWVAFTCSAWAVELTQQPTVSIVGTQAVLQWKTDVECGSRVRYGLAPDKLDSKAGEGVAIQHRVQITGLKPGTTYHYTVGTARELLARGEFTTANGASGTVGKQGSPASTERKAAPEVSPKSVTKVPAKAPPTRQTWASMDSLQDHFDRHGPDFKAKDPDEYAAMAWHFLQRAIDEQLPVKLDESDGTYRIYDAKTGAFAAYRRDGRTRTFFKPSSRDYFQRQPGRSVRLRR